MGAKLTHIDEHGRARMVDVSGKAETAREALAKGVIRMKPETLQLAVTGQGKKGEVLGTAEIAGIMAAKRCSDLIPMCHPVILSSVKVRVDPLAHGFQRHAFVGRLEHVVEGQQGHRGGGQGLHFHSGGADGLDPGGDLQA